MDFETERLAEENKTLRHRLNESLAQKKELEIALAKLRKELENVREDRRQSDLFSGHHESEPVRITATEIIRRNNEPVGNPYKPIIDDMINRTFDLMVKEGLVPTPPKPCQDPTGSAHYITNRCIETICEERRQRDLFPGHHETVGC